MSARQFLYLSHATREMSTADLRELLIESRELNRDHGITGLLIYVGRHFMQCIEGKDEEIGQLVRNISADARNESFTRLLDREVAERAFPAWSMGFHAPSIPELRSEPGFADLQVPLALESLEHRDAALMALMKNFYSANAPRL